MMDVQEFPRESALAMGTVMGGEWAGVLQSPLNKNKLSW